MYCYVLSYITGMLIPMPVKKHSSGEEDTWDIQFRTTPNQGLERSFCCIRRAKARLKGVFVSQTPVPV